MCKGLCEHACRCQSVCATVCLCACVSVFGVLTCVGLTACVPGWVCLCAFVWAWGSVCVTVRLSLCGWCEIMCIVMYVREDVFWDVCISIYVGMCVMYVGRYTGMYVFTHVCRLFMYTCMTGVRRYSCTYVCMMYVCMCMFVFLLGPVCLCVCLLDDVGCAVVNAASCWCVRCWV